MYMEVKDLCKSYGEGGSYTQVLKNVSLEVQKGEMCVIQVCQYLTRSPLDLNELLRVLGLTEHRNKFPSQLSGGQQQRCAIARAH